MKIGIANDHAGYNMKKEIIEKFKNVEFIDYGSEENPSNYPVYAFKLGEAIRDKEVDFGIAICGTGIGISIACNKVKSVICARVCTNDDAYLARTHNNANIIALSGDNKDFEQIIKTFLETDFSNEERHIRRVNLINNY